MYLLVSSCIPVWNIFREATMLPDNQERLFLNVGSLLRASYFKFAKNNKNKKNIFAHNRFKIGFKWASKIGFIWAYNIKSIQKEIDLYFCSYDLLLKKPHRFLKWQTIHIQNNYSDHGRFLANFFAFIILFLFIPIKWDM